MNNEHIVYLDQDNKIEIPREIIESLSKAYDGGGPVKFKVYSPLNNPSIIVLSPLWLDAEMYEALDIYYEFTAKKSSTKKDILKRRSDDRKRL